MIKITVEGKPAPQGSKTRNRYGAIYESNKSVGPWREAVRAETQDVMAEFRPETTPVSVRIRFRLTRPRSHYGSGRNALTLKPSAPGCPTTKPDADKLARAVLDGLTAGGAYRDDSQVIHLEDWKVYADRPGADITIQEVEG